MYRRTFTLYDIFVTVLSFVTFILDVVTDIAVTVIFFLNGHAVWGAISLSFVALSTFAMQIFSFCWHVTDGTMTVRNFLMHALFLAPLHRYWRVLKLGIKSRRTKSQDDLEAVYCANNDVCLLRLFESFLESAPQLLLQLYVIITYHHFDWLLGISTFFSLTSIAWSVSAYSDGLRLAYQTEYRRSGLTMLVHTLWQTAMLSGRVLAIVVFASYFQAWTFLVLGLHWLLMTAWITVQNADFGDTACEKRIFNAVSGFIYIFCFLNLKDGPSRRRMAVYYIITLIENSVLVIFWFLYKSETSPEWLTITTPTVIYGGFVLGSIMMCLYYCCCHPSMPKTQKEQEPETNWFKRIVRMKRQEPRNPFLNTSDSSFRISEWLTTSVNLSNCDRQNNSVQLSLNSSVPDVVPKKNPPRFLSGKSLSTYHRAPSIESSLQESEGNLTLESGRMSYVSANSTKQLISSNSKTSLHKMKTEVNRAFARDQTSSIGLVLKVEDSPQGNKSSGNSSNEQTSFLSQNKSSYQKYDKDSPQSVQSWRDELLIASGSGNSSLECERKKLSMSPLDPAKLWELSQQRMTLEHSSDFHDSAQHISQSTKGNNSCQLNSQMALPVHLNVSGTRSSSGRRSHYSTTFSDSQYNSNSEVSGERYDGSYSYSNTSRSRFQSHGQSGTSDNVESSELSNFFADISSLHVPKSVHGRYISSVSEIVDPMNGSFPWPDDHEVFYDEGDISELVYKQNIRESLQGKSYMYHICQISDATQLDETPRRLSYRRPSNMDSTSDMTQRSIFLSGMISEKSTDDSGYHFSEEAEDNLSRNSKSYKEKDSVLRCEDTANFNRAVIIDSTSSGMSLMRSDHTDEGTTKRRSLLPGLSYLMSDSDTSYMDNSTEPTSYLGDSPMQGEISDESYNKLGNYASFQNKKDSPLQVSTIETSPQRFGRNVDLFNSSRLELSDLEAPKVCLKPPAIPPMSRLEQLQVMDLKESPYKFRERSQENVPHSSVIEKERNELSISDLNESPYKFRTRSSEHFLPSKTNRKFYTIPEKRAEEMDAPHKKSNFSHRDKENRFVDENRYYTAPMPKSKKKSKRNAKSAAKHSKPRTHVSAFKNSCYAYSDTDSDGDLPSDFSSRSQYGDFSDQAFGFSPMKSSKTESRRALKSLENSPTFSPIITPDRMNNGKVCNASGPIMKPCVSTPVPRSVYGGSDNALYLVDEPSTIAV